MEKFIAMQTLTRKRLGWIASHLVCLIVLLWPPGAPAAEKGWVEVRSPHFRVLSDGSEKEARAVARQFEQIRVAFATALPSLHLESPVPLLILALKDEASARRLLPEMWKRKALRPAGFFAAGREKAFAVVRLDVVRSQSESQAAGNGYQVVYHEYTHSLLNANFRWLPLWLNEGLAEFFGNTEFESNKIYIGAPNIRAEYTRGRPLLQLEKLLDVVPASPEYRDEDKVQLFYSESWGLVHFLLVPSSTDRGQRLKQYLTLVDRGIDARQAFREAIGDLRETEDQLKRYLDRSALDVFVFNNPSEIIEDTFSARQLNPAETNAELGTVQVWLHENAAARQRLEQALKDDTRSALATEAMGFLSFNEGKDQEALTDFERALRLDGKLYLSAYYGAMLSPMARSDAADSRAAFRAALNHVQELNHEFAPAYVQLAASYIQEGNFESAAALAVKAAQLRPSLGGYHTLAGNILHALGRDSEAAAVARYVAERWQDIDHDEAVELWQKLSPDVRQGADLFKRPALSGTRVISGKMTSVTCRKKDQTMSVVIDGTPLTFRAKDEKISLGLSDSVWYGADHFSRCHHLDGLRAVIQYKPSSTSSISGDLAQFEVHEDFAFPPNRD